MGTLRLVLWVAAGLALIGLATANFMLGPNVDERSTTLEAENEPGGPFSLTDHTGRAVTHESFAGKHLLVYFGFSTCPDVCPTTLHVISSALDELGAKAERLQPLFITIDPERDTPAVLSDYLDFDRRILGLTGAAAQIEEAAVGYKVFYRRVEDEGSAMGYTMDHTDIVFLMEPGGGFATFFTSETSPQEMAKALRKAL